MSCSCCCHKPRFKRLVDSLYPQDYQSADPVIHDLEKLLYLARSDPQSLDDVGEYLTWRLRRALVRDRIGHVCVSLKIMDKLLSEVRVEHLSLLAESFLNMIHELLQSNNYIFQNLAANSFVAFAEQPEESPPYHHQYDFCIDRFASMSLLKNENNQSMYKESRLSGLRALRGVVQKIGHEESDIWDSDHLNKIIPAYLINMKDHMNTISLEGPSDSGGILGETAECGLKELVTVASFSRANAILHPVLCHFDLNSLWLDDNLFAINTFVLIIKTMQPQVRYLSIQALLSHLDSKPSNQHRLKRGILEVLSSCVGVATDGSIGPSVLDVFRTLVKHLHNSVEESEAQEQNNVFHETIVRIVGEFAAVLPDYHNPDIMNLIFSYLPFEGDGNIKAIHKCSNKQAEFISLLVKCLDQVADSSHPAVIDSTLPESLLSSLSQLMDVQRSDIQLYVLHLWQKMIDHNNNKTKVQKDITWKSFNETGLSLGNAPIRFRHQARKLLFPKLLNLANGLYATTEHAIAFYTLLFLITLEFLAVGSNDILILMVELENVASEMAVVHGNFVHSCVAGCLHLVSVVSEDKALVEHLENVIKKRNGLNCNLLLPAGLSNFVSECSSEIEFHIEAQSDKKLDQSLLFNLIQNGFISHPTEFARNSSSSREYSAFSDHSRSFRSYSGEHSENKAPKEEFTFDDLKEETRDTQPIPIVVDNIAPSFEEMMEHVQDSSHREDIEEILKSAMSINTDETPTTYDLDLNFL